MVVNLRGTWLSKCVCYCDFANQENFAANHCEMNVSLRTATLCSLKTIGKITRLGVMMAASSWTCAYVHPMFLRIGLWQVATAPKKLGEQGHKAAETVSVFKYRSGAWVPETREDHDLQRGSRGRETGGNHRKTSSRPSVPTTEERERQQKHVTFRLWCSVCTETHVIEDPLHHAQHKSSHRSRSHVPVLGLSRSGWGEKNGTIVKSSWPELAWIAEHAGMRLNRYQACWP